MLTYGKALRSLCGPTTNYDSNGCVLIYAIRNKEGQRRDVKWQGIIKMIIAKGPSYESQLAYLQYAAASTMTNDQCWSINVMTTINMMDITRTISKIKQWHMKGGGLKEGMGTYLITIFTMTINERTKNCIMQIVYYCPNYKLFYEFEENAEEREKETKQNCDDNLWPMDYSPQDGTTDSHEMSKE